MKSMLRSSGRRRTVSVVVLFAAWLMLPAAVHLHATSVEGATSGTLSVAAPDALAPDGYDHLAEAESAEQAIQSAIDALPEAGGTVVLSEGTFAIDEAIVLPNDRPVTVRGQGAATVIDAGDGGSNGFELTGGPGATLRDMALRGMRHGVFIGATDPLVDHESVEIRHLRFEQMDRSALTASGGLDVLIERIVIADNHVRDAGRAFVLRNRRIQRADILNNRISDLTFRGIMVGTNTYSDEHYWRNITIAGNSIRDIINEGESHVMGVLGYGWNYHVAHNRIENVRTEGTRAEGIYLKVTHSNVTHNKLIDAGGSVGAIGLPGSPREADPPTSPQGYSNAVTNNVIQFHDPTVRNPRGIDLRQQELLVAGNIIEGFRGGIIARRGGHHVIANNRLSQPTPNATRYVFGISAQISTGSSRLGDEQNLIITGNEIYNFDTGEQSAYGLSIDNNRAADRPSRFDNMTITDNLFWNFNSDNNIAGIRLRERSDEPGGMTRLQIKNNLFENVGASIDGTDTGDIGELVIEGNIGYATEATGSATLASGEQSIEISHDLVDAPARVLVTPRGDPGGGLWVSQRDDETFTVTRAGTDGTLKLDWTAKVEH